MFYFPTSNPASQVDSERFWPMQNALELSLQSHLNAFAHYSNHPHKLLSLITLPLKLAEQRQTKRTRNRFLCPKLSLIGNVIWTISNIHVPLTFPLSLTRSLFCEAKKKKKIYRSVNLCAYFTAKMDSASSPLLTVERIHPNACFSTSLLKERKKKDTCAWPYQCPTLMEVLNIYIFSIDSDWNHSLVMCKRTWLKQQK